MLSKIKLLKFADKLLGGPLSFFITTVISPELNQPDELKNILLIRPGGIGDAVLLIPSIKALNKEYPESTIDVLVEKRNSEIFKIDSIVNNIYLYDDLKNSGLTKILKNSYDVVIDTEQWHKLSSLVTYLTKAPVRIGYSTNGRAGMYSDTVEYNQDDYEAVSFLNLVSKLTGKNHRFNKKGGFINQKHELNIDIYSEYKEQFDTIVGIFPGATVNERRWGVNNFSALAEKLISNNIGVIILGGKNDVHYIEQFENLLGEKKYLNLIGETTLDETTSLISELDLLVSTDGGLMHIAYGAGTSTLSLFGAGIEKKWGPKGPENYVINKNLFCSPCTEFGNTPRCPIGVRCLKEIGVDVVYALAIKILKTKS